ncbi:hypothetical protein [Denitratisoma oestradiolicum]|uniref:Uncharacterized protein n=1 Tax=Denitratisoma oestradiolicum TaxID=311182 RepID=A0A6S6XW39_9PROT|nr:hypothetical protein [Denitratisoma oestradiolicum]TWO81273.1 hypothetical protein CBW56_03905 [Denitratisoma oestradiolicum]CAB1368453.1 protein of unknown function [Denitratisoma oestradiolicum]
MDEPRITANVMLHGFPDLCLGGSSRPTLDLELAPGVLTGRGIFKALLDRFGPPLVPALGPARDAGCRLKNVHLFVNDKAINDADEALESHVDASGRIRVLLILVKAIASG